jgi:thioredoxin 1
MKKILDFWADWCGPCKKLAPSLEQMGEKYKEAVSIEKVNVDEDENCMIEKYKIINVPTLIFIEDGKEVSRSVGAISEVELEQKIVNFIK